METIQAHRKRVTELSDIFHHLLEMERELLDLRAKSWGLQVAGLQTREADLHEVHQTIDDKILEVENLRQELTSPAPGRADGDPGQLL